MMWLLNCILHKCGSWWMNWQHYVGLVSIGENDSEQLPQARNRPGEIDNSKLVSSEAISDSDEPDLQRTLREGQDYALVAPDVWQRLYEWYAMQYVCFFYIPNSINCTRPILFGVPLN
jgi:hypothetical protein